LFAFSIKFIISALVKDASLSLIIVMLLLFISCSINDVSFLLFSIYNILISTLGVDIDSSTSVSVDPFTFIWFNCFLLLNKIKHISNKFRFGVGLLVSA
jgi:hypothetical protein